MALINCDECGKQISDQAHFCPNCGKPKQTPIVIEQTSKQWKKLQIASWMFFTSGVVLSLMMWNEKADFGRAYFFVGILLVITGLVMYNTAKIGSWWTNK